MMLPRYAFRATAILIATSITTLAAQRSAVDARIDSLIARMTVEEKLGQLNLLSVNGRPSPEQLELVRQGKVGGFFNLLGADATHDAQHVAVTESRLRIPLIFGYDAIHGYKTTFPIPLAAAASWDPEAVEAGARVSAREAAASGVHWTFAPMVDIARDPRWGRIAEGAGEDPYLGSAMAAARGRGFQGTDPPAPHPGRAPGQNLPPPPAGGRGRGRPGLQHRRSLRAHPARRVPAALSRRRRRGCRQRHDVVQ